MLEDIKRELHKQLYLDNQENEQIDEISLKKHLYLLIRECLKEREYEVFIGSYKINITPKNLSVKYENEQTKVEVNPVTKYVENYDKLQFYAQKQILYNELETLESYFQSLFIADDEEYVFWKNWICWILLIRRQNCQGVGKSLKTGQNYGTF